MARHCSIILCASVALLVGLGLVMLASTSAWVSGMENPYHFLTRQACFAVAGLVFAMCDGETAPTDMAKRLADHFALADAPTDDVARTLSELSKIGVITL